MVTGAPLHLTPFSPLYPREYNALMPDWLKELTGIVWGSLDIVLEILVFMGVTLYLVSAPSKSTSTEVLWAVDAAAVVLLMLSILIRVLRKPR